MTLRLSEGEIGVILKVGNKVEYGNDNVYEKEACWVNSAKFSSEMNCKALELERIINMDIEITSDDKFMCYSRYRR